MQKDLDYKIRFSTKIMTKLMLFSLAKTLINYDSCMLLLYPLAIMQYINLKKCEIDVNSLSLSVSDDTDDLEVCFGVRSSDLCTFDLCKAIDEWLMLVTSGGILWEVGLLPIITNNG